MVQKGKGKCNLKKGKSTIRKNIWKSWADWINKVVGWLNKIYWTLLKVVLGLTVCLEIMFLRILPNDIRKGLIVFYIFGIGFMIALVLIEEHRKDKGLNVEFIEISWLSYFTFVIAWVPVVCMLLYVFIIIVQESCFGLEVRSSAEFLLQLVYWMIAIANLMWFMYHICIRNVDQEKINLMLKLMVVIISGTGLVMDFVGKIDFTKQFLFIAWSVLLLSYISDKKQNSMQKGNNFGD